jgi:hypothetical protein
MKTIVFSRNTTSQYYIILVCALALISICFSACSEHTLIEQKGEPTFKELNHLQIRALQEQGWLSTNRTKYCGFSGKPHKACGGTCTVGSHTHGDHTEVCVMCNTESGSDKLDCKGAIIIQEDIAHTAFDETIYAIIE